MGSGLQTRRSANGRALVVNALVKPRNLGVGVGLLVAGLITGWTLVLGLLAIVVYGVLAAFTLFDDREAKRVLDRRRGSK